ncbi:EAL domain-containing protein [Paenibacillus hamazuiensis]|uniref:EAL domain-containing protein n=1 Tax=Paenibacillus hamazuiensis TaxID=2936508 RepID=UPI00200E0E11|nr:EAL domain-containing protein [Paenibacillus hamazuiensis]
MARNVEGSKWKERLKLMVYLPFPNSALKYFPPEFTFRDPILSLVKQYRHEGRLCGMILFHLENYTRFYSTHSYSSIKQLQNQIKQVMKAVVAAHIAPQDILGIKQFSGDNYGVIVKEHADFSFDELQRKGMQIRHELERQMRLWAGAGTSGPIVFRVGCYVIGQEIESAETALSLAYHYALSIATRRLPGSFSQSRQHILQIVQSENISVLAQPIMDLRSGDIFGWEMLSRGPHNSPFHTPVELFDFAYQADVLSKLEFLVFKKACEEISARQIKEQVFINLTPVTLGHPLFLNQVLELLEGYPNLSPCQIIIEITERHAIQDFEYIGSILAKYRSYGFRFAVDDAGAGYSSLQSISELIPDIIKIDKSVIQNIDTTSVKQSLLQALLHFAQHINCQVIAEGVERQEEAEVLVDMEVPMGQGFFFAKPAPWMTEQDRQVQMSRAKERIPKSRKVSSA